MKLDADEKELLESVERGEWKCWPTEGDPFPLREHGGLLSQVTAHAHSRGGMRAPFVPGWD
jgi:hypothetical protein